MVDVDVVVDVPLVLVPDIVVLVDDVSVDVVAVERDPLLRVLEVVDGRSGGLVAVGTDEGVGTVESVPVITGAVPTRGVDEERVVEGDDETLVDVIMVVVVVDPGTVMVAAVSVVMLAVSVVAVVSVVVVSVF